MRAGGLNKTVNGSRCEGSEAAPIETPQWRRQLTTLLYLAAATHPRHSIIFLLKKKPADGPGPNPMEDVKQAICKVHISCVMETQQITL